MIRGELCASTLGSGCGRVLARFLGIVIAIGLLPDSSATGDRLEDIKVFV